MLSRMSRWKDRLLGFIRLIEPIKSYLITYRYHSADVSWPGPSWSVSESSLIFICLKRCPHR